MPRGERPALVAWGSQWVPCLSAPRPSRPRSLTSLQHEDFEQVVQRLRGALADLQAVAHAEAAQRAHQRPGHGELRHVLRGDLAAPRGPRGRAPSPACPGDPVTSDFPSPPHGLGSAVGAPTSPAPHSAGKGDLPSQHPGEGAARPPAHWPVQAVGPPPGSPGQGPPPRLGCICLLRAHRSRGTKALWPPSRDPCGASHTPGTHCQLSEIADKPQDPGNGAQDPGLLVHFIRLHQARQDNLQKKQGDPTHTFRGVPPSPLSPTSPTSASEPSRCP